MPSPVKTLVVILILLSVALPGVRGTEFIRGDVNGDAEVDVLVDTLFLVLYLFVNGDTPPCMKAADADGSGSVFALLGAGYVLNYAFAAGPILPDPFPDCGLDVDNLSDGLSCDETPDCI